MSSPAGDLPDWQTLVTPLVQPASQIGSGATSGLVIASFGTPFRIWGAWIAASFVTDNAYNLGVQQIDALIEDGAGNGILALPLGVSFAEQTMFDSVAIGVSGLTPVVHTGNFEVLLVVTAPGAHSFVRVSAGIYYSDP